MLHIGTALVFGLFVYGGGLLFRTQNGRVFAVAVDGRFVSIDSPV